jgi:hypothetical protein
MAKQRVHKNENKGFEGGRYARTEEELYKKVSCSSTSARPNPEGRVRRASSGWTQREGEAPTEADGSYRLRVGPRRLGQRGVQHLAWCSELIAGRR